MIYKVNVAFSFIVLFVLFQNCGKGFKANSNLTLLESNDLNLKKSVTCQIFETAPSRLRQTCYSEIGREYINLKSYTPQYPLYSDAAEKNRWYYIPQDTSIDTKDMSNWIYPVGFILWKDFIVGGRKVETRMLEKIKNGIGSANWRNTVYVWRSDQSDADRTDNASLPRIDQNYEFSSISNYKLFGVNQCMQCHNSAKDYSLGFTAIQLSNLSKDGNLTELAMNSHINSPPTRPISIPGTDLDKMTLGYLSSNCGTCHAPGGIAEFIGMNLKLNLNANTLQETNTYLTTVSNGSGRVIPKNLTQSRLFQRVSEKTMPPRAILNTTDPYIVKTLEDWIMSLN